MKDDRDTHTMDGLPKKMGRPVLDLDAGPLTPAQKMARYRQGKAVVQFRLMDKDKNKLMALAKKKGLHRDELLTAWIRRAR